MGVVICKRPDFRFPSSMMVVGPSASNFFQGGDSTALRPLELGGGGVSPTRRRLAGRSSSGDPDPWTRPFVAAGPLTWPFSGNKIGSSLSEDSSGVIESADRPDTSDSGELEAESASRPASRETWRLCVSRGGRLRGDLEVLEPLVAPLSAAARTLGEDWADSSSGADAVAAVSVMATRAKGRRRGWLGSRSPPDTAFGIAKTASASLVSVSLSRHQVCACRRAWARLQSAKHVVGRCCRRKSLRWQKAEVISTKVHS